MENRIMGIFYFIGDVTEKVVETVVSLPAAPIKIVEGGIKGVGKGIAGRRRR